MADGGFDPTDYDAPNAAADPLGIEGPGDDGDPAAGEEDPALAQERQLRDAILFVVDCASPGALDPLQAGGRSVVGEALAAAVSVLKTKVITSPEDRVGVVFYGVREKLNPNGFEGIRVVQELDRPSAQRIRQLETEASRSKAHFEERYGCARPAPLSDVFWTCTTIFNLSANPKQFQPRVFLFTGCDDPAATAAERDAAETRAQDLMDLGVDVEFFPLLPQGGAFSIEKFWGRVLPVDTADHIAQAALRVEELERRVRRRLHRKRTLQRLTLELCEGVEVAISVFVHIFEAKVPYPVYLLNENNKPLKSETRSICEQTGSILHPEDDIETYVDLNGERVYMTRAEIDETKRLGDPGLKLLGVKDASCLKSHHRIFHSYFVYPNDRMIAGSGQLCAALIECLAARRKIALVRYVARKSSNPVLAALVPQVEREEVSGGDQVCPPGFHMVLLPWGEDIRSLSFPAPEGAPAPLPQGLQDAARSVVNAMRLDGFVPGCVENPVLQKHFAAVQALALAEEQPEEVVDMLRPDEGALNDKAPLLAAWRDAIDACAPAPAFGGGGAYGKRGAPGGAGDFAPGADFGYRAPKAPRREAAPAPSTVEEMRALVHSGEVERLTAPVLRDWLKAQGIAASGKKGDLVERVRAVV
eukprot:TRINITY_DN16878_c1_g6_i1.p1 TRINITY_DN16878_c1_g6~~TRINITY_DN16878_c1_g6_i1.p1  ORF type:complete len:664 (+),score=145.51 TRINITY_DN16878_c1_g6_i1:60-1994(+)